MIALLARVAVILCVATPRAAATGRGAAAQAREHQGGRRRGHHDERRGAQAHIARHALDQEPREMSGPWVDDPAANDGREDDAGRGRRGDDDVLARPSARPGVEMRPARRQPTRQARLAVQRPGSIIPRRSTSRPRPCITASASDATSRSTRRC